MSSLKHLVHVKATRRRWKPLADRCRETGSDADFSSTGDVYACVELPATLVRETAALHNTYEHLHHFYLQGALHGMG
jgi:hypothetical protein